MRGHIRRRGSKWVLVVDVGRDEQGRRRQRWVSGFETKREATAALTDILGRLQTGTYVLPTKKTTREFLEEWLHSVRATIRPTTWRGYRHALNKHVLPRIGWVPLQRLPPATLNGLYADLLGSTDATGGIPGPTTVRMVHSVLHRALSDAVRWGFVPYNVADRADPPRRNSPEMKTWTAEEVRWFLEGVREDRLYALWLLAATTGMRRGELLGLKWRDVDFERHRLSVRRSLVAIGHAPVFHEPKTTKGKRSVALDPSTVAALREHRRPQLEERIAWGAAYHDDDLVFCREDGRPYDPAAITTWFRRAADATDLPRIRLHDLRHTHATLALAAGVHPKVVSERLGHSTVSITLDTYSHAIPALQEEAAAKIASLILGTA